MTKAAQQFGKEAKEFLRLDSTKECIDALENVGISHLYEATRGRHSSTWAHPKLAVFFAMWLDVRFSLWVTSVIEDILTGAAEVTIVSAWITSGQARKPPTTWWRWPTS
jgi:hypothetical protein